MFISDCSAISTSHTFPAYLTGLQTHQCSAHYTIESKRGSSAAHRCDAVIDRRPGVFYSSLNIFLRSLSVAQRPAYRIPWTATHPRAPGIRLPHRVNAFNFARWLSKSRLVCGSWYLSACARTHLRIQLHTRGLSSFPPSSRDGRPFLLPQGQRPLRRINFARPGAVRDATYVRQVQAYAKGYQHSLPSSGRSSLDFPRLARFFHRFRTVDCPLPPTPTSPCNAECTISNKLYTPTEPRDAVHTYIHTCQC